MTHPEDKYVTYVDQMIEAWGVSIGAARKVMREHWPEADDAAIFSLASRIHADIGYTARLLGEAPKKHIDSLYDSLHKMIDLVKRHAKETM